MFRVYELHCTRKPDSQFNNRVYGPVLLETSDDKAAVNLARTLAERYGGPYGVFKVKFELQTLIGVASKRVVYEAP